MRDSTRAEEQDLGVGVERELRPQTGEVRLVEDVQAVRETLGPRARAILDALPRFTPVLSNPRMFQ